MKNPETDIHQDRVAPIFEKLGDIVKSSNPFVFLYRAYLIRMDIEKGISDIVRIAGELRDDLDFLSADNEGREGILYSNLHSVGFESSYKRGLLGAFVKSNFANLGYLSPEAHFSVYLEIDAESKKNFFNRFLGAFRVLRRREAMVRNISAFISSDPRFNGFLNHVLDWIERVPSEEVIDILLKTKNPKSPYLRHSFFLRKWFESHLASLPKDCREDFVKSVFEEDFAIDESAFESFDLTNLLRVSRSMRIRTRESSNDNGIDASLVTRVLKLARDLPPGIPAFLRIFEIVSQCRDSNARADIWEQVRKAYLPELSV